MRRGSWFAALLALGLLVACDGGGDDDAGVDAGGEDGGDGFFDCDPRNVSCDAPTPMCMTGFVPTVEDGCWGPCLQAAGCRPIACDEATVMEDCPGGWGCVLGMCRPPR